MNSCEWFALLRSVVSVATHPWIRFLARQSLLPCRYTSPKIRKKTSVLSHFSWNKRHQHVEPMDCQNQTIASWCFHSILSDSVDNWRKRTSCDVCLVFSEPSAHRTPSSSSASCLFSVQRRWQTSRRAKVLFQEKEEKESLEMLIHINHAECFEKFIEIDHTVLVQIDTGGQVHDLLFI